MTFEWMLGGKKEMENTTAERQYVRLQVAALLSALLFHLKRKRAEAKTWFTVLNGSNHLFTWLNSQLSNTLPQSASTNTVTGLTSGTVALKANNTFKDHQRRSARAL